MAKTLKKRIRNRGKKSLQRGGRRPTKKTLKKKQRGGIGAMAIIAGISTLALTAAGAFAKYKHSELITERNKIDIILSQSVDLEYLPKYSVTNDKGLIERYLKCVTDNEFIEIVASNQEYLKSDTIDMLLKPYKDIDPELRDLTEKIGLLTGSEDRSLQIDTIELTSSSDKLVQDLNYYLLASAKLKDNEYPKGGKNKIAKAKVNWVDIVFEGGSSFDPELDNEVDRILEGRESSYFITDEIKILLSGMKDNNNLIQAINKKMEDCTKNPRSYWDFIRGNIKWNNTKNA